MSEDWDLQFEREVPREAVPDAVVNVLNFQLDALMSGETRFMTREYVKACSEGSIYVKEDHPLCDENEKTYNVTIFGPIEEDMSVTPYLHFVFTPDGKVTHVFDKDRDIAYEESAAIAEALLQTEDVDEDDAAAVRAVAEVLDAVKTNAQADISEQAINLYLSIRRLIIYHVNDFTLSSTVDLSDVKAELTVQMQGYVCDENIPGTGNFIPEFEIFHTDRSSNLQTWVGIDADRVVTIDSQAPVDVEVREYSGKDDSVYEGPHLATMPQLETINQLFINRLHNQLGNQHSHWLNDYAARLGDAVHELGPESPLASTFLKELNYVQALVMVKVKRELHVLPLIKEGEIPLDLAVALSSNGANQSKLVVRADYFIQKSKDGEVTMSLDPDFNYSVIVQRMYFPPLREPRPNYTPFSRGLKLDVLTIIPPGLTRLVTTYVPMTLQYGNELRIPDSGGSELSFN